MCGGANSAQRLSPLGSREYTNMRLHSGVSTEVHLDTSKTVSHCHCLLIVRFGAKMCVVNAELRMKVTQARTACVIKAVNGEIDAGYQFWKQPRVSHISACARPEALHRAWHFEAFAPKEQRKGGAVS